jgi:hypothetical protein
MVAVAYFQECEVLRSSENLEDTYASSKTTAGPHYKDLIKLGDPGD